MGESNRIRCPSLWLHPYLIRQGGIFNLNDEPLRQVYCQVGSVAGVGDVSDVFSVTSSRQFWWILIGCRCFCRPSRCPERGRNGITRHCICCCGIHLSVKDISCAHLKPNSFLFRRILVILKTAETLFFSFLHRPTWEARNLESQRSISVCEREQLSLDHTSVQTHNDSDLCQSLISTVSLLHCAEHILKGSLHCRVARWG